MKKTIIKVHNNQKIELYQEKRNIYNETWYIANIKGIRTIIGHEYTHDDLEACLHYSIPNDLIWRESSIEEIPDDRSPHALEMEQLIKNNVFMDSHGESVAWHFGVIKLLPLDKKECRLAENRLIGKWTDGVITMNIEPEHKYSWICNDENDVIKSIFNQAACNPDWWNYFRWEFALLNENIKCGTHFHIFLVTESELHIQGNMPHQLVRIFRKM